MNHVFFTGFPAPVNDTGCVWCRVYLGPEKANQTKKTINRPRVKRLSRLHVARQPGRNVGDA